MNLQALLAQEQFLSAKLEIVTEDEKGCKTTHSANLNLSSLVQTLDDVNKQLIAMNYIDTSTLTSNKTVTQLQTDLDYLIQNSEILRYAYQRLIGDLQNVLITTNTDSYVTKSAEREEIPF